MEVKKKKKKLLPGDGVLDKYHQYHSVFYGLRSPHWTSVPKQKRKKKKLPSSSTRDLYENSDTTFFSLTFFSFENKAALNIFFF